MTVFPQCLDCKHFHGGSGQGEGDLTCDAYPDAANGIPEPILLNDHDHREAYRGDHGIRFKAKVEPEPVIIPIPT
jgi:hypothetical protein